MIHNQRPTLLNTEIILFQQTTGIVYNLYVKQNLRLTMVTPISSAHRPAATQQSLESPVRDRVTHREVRTPHSTHFLNKLPNVNTPEKDYLKDKRKHTVIPTANSKASPFKDAEKIRQGLAKIKSIEGVPQYSVTSESTGHTRTYQAHLSGSSKRLVPVDGPGFVTTKGYLVAKAIDKYQKENRPTVINTTDLYGKLCDLANEKPEVAPPEKPTSSASSLAFVPRSVALKRPAPPPVEESDHLKRLASKSDSLYPLEWGVGKKESSETSEPPQKRLKLEES